MRHYLSSFHDFPMPKPRADAYYTEYLEQARKELERNRYAFCDKTGTEYESGSWCGRYSSPSDYDASFYATRENIFEDVFTRAIFSRAARLCNLANEAR